jgi:hypothetical protein
MFFDKICKHIHFPTKVLRESKDIAYTASLNLSGDVILAKGTPPCYNHRPHSCIISQYLYIKIKSLERFERAG